MIETGRYKEYTVTNTPGRDDHSHFAALSSLFWKQVEYCQAAVLDGPGKIMQWGIPDGTRDPETGKLLHDDLLISAALCAVLDKQPWGTGESRVAVHNDPLAGLGEAF